MMKPFPLIIILALVAVGAAVAYVTIKPPQVTPVGNGANTPAIDDHDDHDGHDHGDHDGHDHAAHSDDDGHDHSAHSADEGHDHSEHGSFPEIPPGAPMCKKHHLPEMADAFCNPTFVEEFGWCAGHDVPEALCTRCHGMLIPAFKAEGDWCAEHGLPESQCAICNADVVDS